MAEENIIKFKIQSEDTSIEGTRKKIEALKSEMLATTDTDTFNKLALQAGELETEIRRVEDAVTSLAGSGSELTKMSNSFSRVGSSLASMDFGAAAEEAGRLAAISKSMNFGSAIASLKSLGSTFMSLGKALLTNPFFLLVGVVTAIVVAIVKLMDELGILTAIFDAVGEAVGWVIQQLKDMLDWLGLTSYAADEEAEKEKKRQADIKAAREAAFNQYITEKELEIAKMKAEGASIEDIENAEISLSITRLEAAKARLKQEESTTQAMIDQLKAWGQLAAATKLQNELDKQRNEVKQLEIAAIETQTRVDDQRTNRAKANAAESNKLAEQKKKTEEEILAARLRADKIIEEANIMQISDEIERDRQLAIFKENQAFEELDKTKLTQEQIETLTEQHNYRLQSIEDRAQERKTEQLDKEKEAHEKMLAEKAAKEKKAADEATAAAEETAQKQIELDQATEQMKTDLTNQSFAALQANLKQGSKMSKGVALAQATFDTFKGVQAIFANAAANPSTILFPAQPFIAAASALAFGLANVRSILTTPDVATSAPSGGGASFAPPSFGTRSESNTTPAMNINDSPEQNAGGSVNRQVMVVDYTDIANKGKEVNKLQNRVSLI
jgi:hypothetical protein